MDSSRNVRERGNLPSRIPPVNPCYRPAMMRRVGLLAVLAAAACSSTSEVKSTSGPDPIPARPTFTLFAVAELRGQIGPCGCTTDPLGDLSRTAQLVVQARAAGPVMFVDAGSLLYSHAPTPPQLAAQEELKADLLAEAYQKTLLADAVGLGPADVPNGAGGLEHLRLARVVANPPAGSGLSAAPKLLDAGGAQVGVFGVLAGHAVVSVAGGD